MTNDPWAAAGSAGASQTTSPGQQGGGSALAGAMPGGGLGGSALFGGGGKRIPSLFNATHSAGTVRGGVIVDIKDVHSRTHAREGGMPRYWEDGKSGKGNAPVTNPISTITGKPNEKVIDIHIILDTAYRLSEQEIRELERDPADAEADDGQRVYVVSDLKQFGEAMQAYNAENANTPGFVPLTDPSHLIGVRLDAKRMVEPRGKGQAYPVKLSRVTGNA